MERKSFSVTSVAFVGVAVVLVVGESFPPERYAGQSARSSGNEAPPRALGARCDRIAAAYKDRCIRRRGKGKKRIYFTSRSWTCWCLLRRDFEVSRQCGECSQRCLTKQDGWR